MPSTIGSIDSSEAWVLRAEALRAVGDCRQSTTTEKWAMTPRWLKGLRPIDFSADWRCRTTPQYTRLLTSGVVTENDRVKFSCESIDPGVMNEGGVCKLAFVDEDREEDGSKGTPVIWKTLDEVIVETKLKHK